MKAIEKIYLMILSAWFSMTCLIDFVVMPAVFRTLSSRAEAGKVGMKIFMAMNGLEVLFGVLVLGLGIKLYQRLDLKKVLLGLWILLALLAFGYRFHVSPKIVNLANQMHEIGEGNRGYEALAEQHNFYHKLYVKLDGTKLVVLLFILGMGLRQRHKEAA